jgi:hypothetical protein
MLPSVRASTPVLVTAVLLALASPSSALAQEAGDSPRVHPLRFSWARDGILTGAAGVLWISSEALFKEDLAPAKCRWCDRAPDGTDTLNRLDRWGRGLAGNTEASRNRAHNWSNILGFGVVPVGVLGVHYSVTRGNDVPGRVYAEDATIILQSAVLSTVVNQTVKFIAGRERPFVHQLPEEQKGLVDHASDNNLSFYSGHTNLMFSLVVASGTVASLRGYEHQEWIWAAGLPLAASVGLLRMGADKHYLTDVATGAVLGTAFGALVPLLLHGRTSGSEGPDRQAGVSVTPMAGARMAGISGTF